MLRSHNGTLTEDRRAPRHLSPSDIADFKASSRTLFAEEPHRSSRPALEEATELWGADALAHLQRRTRAAAVLQQLRDERRLWAPSTGVTEWDAAVVELEGASSHRETTEAEAEAARATLREAPGFTQCAQYLCSLCRAITGYSYLAWGALYYPTGTSLRSPRVSTEPHAEPSAEPSAKPSAEPLPELTHSGARYFVRC